MTVYPLYKSNEILAAAGVDIKASDLHDAVWDCRGRFAAENRGGIRPTGRYHETQLWYLAPFFFVFVAFHIFGFIQLLALPLRESFSDLMLWGSGLAATAVMATYFIATHARLRAQLAHWQEQ